MRALRQFALVICTLVLTFAIVCDVAIAVGLLQHLISGGLRGMNRWIMHIGTEGGMTVEQAGPDSMTLKFPSRANIYGTFICCCAFLVFVTVGSWWGRRILKAKTRLEPPNPD